MAGEHLYYSSGSFAYHTDDDGRLIDNLTGQAFGICSQKKKEILADYEALADENKSLKKRLGEIEKLLEQSKDILPEELKAFIAKPPTVESLQGELSELKRMLTILIDERSGIRDNSPVMQELGAEPGNPKRSGRKAELSGNKPEQSE